MLGGLIANIYDAVVLVVLFGVTIFIHEVGHFVAALRCGMVVETFSLGFGPAMWKREYRGIVYKVGWIPFGGYVALPQLDPSAMDGIQGKSDGAAAEGEPAARRGPLPPISPWKKIIVSFAGVIGNFALAVVMAWVIYLSPSAVTENTGTMIGMVSTNSVAYQRGVRAGDQVLHVNGENVESWNDVAILSLLGAGGTNEVVLTLRSRGGLRDVRLPTVANEMGAQIIDGIGRALPCVVSQVMAGTSADRAGLQAGDAIREFGGVEVAGTGHFIELVGDRGGEDIPLVIERAGKTVSLTVRPEHNEELGRALIGVVVSNAQSGVMPWMQHKKPWAQIKGDAAGIVRILKALVTPSESKQAAQGLGGPVMIIATLWISIQSSFLNALGFLRFLNINLAILNLLPIPVLDGGHIVFSLWEGLTRRRVNARFINVLVNVFATLLIGVFIILTYRDSLRFTRLYRLFGARGDAETTQTNTVQSAEK